jgi:hypothetical protein
MPVVKIFGIPEHQDRVHDDLWEKELVKCRNAIKEALAAIPELGISENQVTVYFIDTLTQTDIGKEVVIDIELHKKPKRTPDVLQKVAQTVAETYQNTFGKEENPQLEMIEASVRLLDPREGFHRIDVKKKS